ncbi:hypothetical protein OE88DRAFT_1735115 [Heliocybe sulcata]|uniref:Uncharacterized protein n=1 Tax=Heliocybe sulcata TaxID=5364 RepID=A0A5C3N296_9AGAM|nr:hypothetical protein OE88DRAFT_1735115 [Heliocybe sulcata]
MSTEIRDEVFRQFGLSVPAAPQPLAQTQLSLPTGMGAGSHAQVFSLQSPGLEGDQGFPASSASSPYVLGQPVDRMSPGSQIGNMASDSSFSSQKGSSSSEATQRYHSNLFDGTNSLWGVGSGSDAALTASGDGLSTSAMAGLLVRRRHDDEDSSHDGTRVRSPTHQLRVYAQQRGDQSQLSQAHMQSLLDFSELSTAEMLIELKLHLIQNEMELIKRFFKFYSRHPDFVTRLRMHLAAALLAPNVRAYVTGMTDQMVAHFKRNVELVLLPPSVETDPVDWKLFVASVSHELTQQRARMKDKLDLSIKNCDDIYTLVSDLMVYGIHAKREHWGRFAFLRNCATQYSSLTAAVKKKRSLWDFVDDELVKIRKMFKDMDKVARALEETTFFANLLKQDTVKYPLNSGELTRAVYSNMEISQTQRNMEEAVARFAVDDKLADAVGDAVE